MVRIVVTIVVAFVVAFVVPFVVVAIVAIVVPFVVPFVVEFFVAGSRICAHRKPPQSDTLVLANVKAVTGQLEEAGANVDGFDAYATGEGKKEAERIRADAWDRGVFGVPTYDLDGELFWGRELCYCDLGTGCVLGDAAQVHQKSVLSR